MSTPSTAYAASALLVFLTACATGSNTTSSTPMDFHSFAQPDEVRVRHVSLDLDLDFDSKSVVGSARLTFDRRGDASSLVLDSKGLEIVKITGGDGSSTDVRSFEAKAADPVLGTAVHVKLEPEDTAVTVHYRTTKGADALQWLAPQQTAGGKLPFLYTQGQAILTRSWIPLQDSPGVRVTYDATVRAPRGMRVVMSADKSAQLDDGRFRFEMTKAIPPYLIALACGDLARKDISARCAVYADPTVVDFATKELEDTDDMLRACEKTFGAYRWGRYDVLILPPAFPFGGMENPTLTFATPMILAGDKSLVALVAHELAHSWSGNLVTNATWRDFWLNEGFTVFLEHRIMELVYGKERADMEVLIGLQGLEEELRELDPRDQILHVDLKGRNPDDGMTSVAYDKGAAFLRRLEQVFGRERFDAFLSKYFDAHAFQSITTADFLAYLQKNLLDEDPAKAKQVDVAKWVRAGGLPSDAPRPSCPAFQQVADFRNRWIGGEAKVEETKGWVTHQWLHFINGLRTNLTTKQMQKLDTDFGFTRSGNSEILAAWLRLAVRRRYQPAYERLEQFLMRVGRRKFLKPLYEALAQTPDGKTLALQIYRKARPRYHAISRRTLDALLGWKD